MGQFSPETTKAAGLRLRRIEGQLKGLQRMLAEERDCTELVQQIAAARAALDRVAAGSPLAELYVPDWVAAQEGVA